jgi:septum site-determining protein MinC
MTNLIAIKGGRDGLRLQFDESAGWAELMDALRDQLDQGAEFYSGAKVVLDLGERPLANDELGALLELMRGHGIEPASVSSTSRESRNAARAAGVAARTHSPRMPSAIERAASEQAGTNEALFVRRTVRSGQVLRHHGHVTVLGDVNAGAEIIAGGSVVVWGRLRGTVHAGALGEREAVICALELAPTQLRIADVIARPPDGRADALPEMARIVEGQISVELWARMRR